MSIIKLDMNKDIRKLSEITSLTTEILYSSDSDCEYRIIQTITKILDTKIGAKHSCVKCPKVFRQETSLKFHIAKFHSKKMKEDCTNIEEIPLVDKHELIDNIKSGAKDESAKSPKCNSSVKPDSLCTITDHQSDTAVISNIDINDPNSKRKRKYIVGQWSRSVLCYICGKQYSHSRGLEIHLRSHNDERPFSCKLCGKSFLAKQHLEKHNLSHTKDYKYKCEVCLKRLVNRCSLREHMLRHTGEKPHVCQVCSKSFTHYNGLKHHLQMHYKIIIARCSICNKGFYNKCHIKEHMRSHTGEKPYSCTKCRKCFVSKSKLSQHMQSHSGLKPFQCTNCNKCFSRSVTLRQHLKMNTICNSLS